MELCRTVSSVPALLCALPAFRGGEGMKKNLEMEFETGKTRILDNTFCLQFCFAP